MKWICHHWFLLFSTAPILLMLLVQIPLVRSGKTCDCMVNLTDKQEYWCSDTQGDIVIKVDLNNGVNVICNGLNDLTYLNALKGIIMNSNLQQFTMTNCSLPDEPFHKLFEILHLNSVTDLNIYSSHNAATRLKSIHFEKMQWLRKLSIEDSDVTELPESIFLECANLRHLYLRKNQLQSWSPKLLQPMSKLEQLYLGFNNFSKLANSAFQYASNLQRLTLNGNTLNEISRSVFDHLYHLTDLVISRSNITKLENGIFQKLSFLVNLEISFNNIYQLPDALLFYNSRLEYIGLRAAFSTKLSSLPFGFFSGLRSLKLVLMDSNSFRTLPPDLFKGCQNLRRVSLRKNFLRVLPTVLFQDSKDIEAIDFSLNILEFVNEITFSKLRKLNYLNLSGNFLKEVSSQFLTNFQSLGTLLLSSNQLRNFDVVLPSALKVLTLDSNELTHLDKQTVEQLRSKNMDMVTLHENPWNCIDFDTRPLVSFLRDQWNIIKSYQDIICREPIPTSWKQIQMYNLLDNGVEVNFTASKIDMMAPGPPSNFAVIGQSLVNGSLNWLLHWSAPPSLIPINKYEVKWETLVDNCVLERKTYISARMDHFWLNDVQRDKEYVLSLKALLKFDQTLIKGQEAQALVMVSIEPPEMRLNESNFQYKDLIRNIKIENVYWIGTNLFADLVWNQIDENADITYIIYWNPHSACKNYNQIMNWGNVRKHKSQFTLHNIIPGCKYFISVKATYKDTLYSSNSSVPFERCVSEPRVFKNRIYEYHDKEEYDLVFESTPIYVENCSLPVTSK